MGPPDGPEAKEAEVDGGVAALAVTPEKGKKPVAAEITLALQMHESRPRSDFVPRQEEKKEEDAGCVAAMTKEAVAMDEPVEEGQEALWVEDEKDLPPFVKAEKSSHDAISKSPRRWKVPSPGRRSSRLEESPETKPSIANRVFLPPKDPPKKPTPLETTVQVKNKQQSKIQREAAQKVETARQLLTQALSPSANVGSRDLLARAAFEHATEARRLLEPTTTPELEALLKDATAKGQAEVSMMRQLQLQLVDSKESSLDTNNTEDEHASRARNLLEFILPEVDTSILAKEPSPATTGSSPGDISTLGFDNTYVGKGGSKDFDILSMSSLNEILDGPLDEDPSCPVIKHRISTGVKEGAKEKANPDVAKDGATEDEAAKGEGAKDEASKDEASKDEASKDEAKVEESAEARTLGVKTDTARSGAKRAGFFGGMFRGKHKGAHPTEEAAAATDKKTTPQRKRWGSKGSKKSPEHREDKNVAAAPAASPQRFVATVYYDEGTDDRAQGIQDMEGEIPNLEEELERIKAVDDKLNLTLQNALDADDNESMTSYQGVPIHGKEEKPKKDDSKENKKKQDDKVENENEAKQEGPREKKRMPSRIFETSKPDFVTAPKGEPAILTAKTWESIEGPPDEQAQLIEGNRADEANPSEEANHSYDDDDSASSSSSDSEDVEKESSVEDEKRALSSPDSTRTASSNDGEDRYTVAPGADGEEEDRYKIPDEESFEAFWDPCSPKILTIIPSADTCSTLGMAAASCLNSDGKIADETSQLETFDKYDPTPRETIQEEEAEEKGAAMDTEGDKVEEAASSAAQPHSETKEIEAESKEPVTETKKDPATEPGEVVSSNNVASASTGASKRQNPGKKKKLKIAGVVAGLFGKKKHKTSTPPRKEREAARNATPSSTLQGKASTTEKKSPTPSRWKSRKQKKEKKGEETPEHRPEQSRITVVTNDAPKVEKEATSDSSDPDTPEPVLNDTVDSEEPADALVDEDVDGAEDPEDPLVAQIKAQALRPPNGGLDPTTVEQEVARRGIDP